MRCLSFVILMNRYSNSVVDKRISLKKKSQAHYKGVKKDFWNSYLDIQDRTQSPSNDNQESRIMASVTNCHYLCHKLGEDLLAPSHKAKWAKPFV